VAERPIRYNGKGFSLRGEKNRFALPASLRKEVIASSGGERTLCLMKHHAWPCLSGFGLSRIETFDALIAQEQQRKTELRQDFDRDAYSMSLYSYEDIPFDASGRFILPDDLSDAGKIGDEVFFHGAGDFFTLWNPSELYGMGPQFDGPKASCRKWQADAAKGRKK
jgi:MraZ protein